MKKKAVITTIIAIIIMISFLICSIYVMAKYVGQMSGTGSANIAKPVLTASGLENLERIKIGANTSYNFSVSNFTDSSNISQVTMNYKLVVNVEANGCENIPFTYKVYDVTDSNNIAEVTITDGISDKIEIGNTTEQTHLYRLDILWGDEINIEDYVKADFDISVTARAEQAR